MMLHGSAGTSSLWGAAKDAFAPLYRVISPDLIGYGQSSAWPDGLPFSLMEEVKRIEPLLPCCERQFDVVGYSYGGAVAVELALANPARVRTLTLIEPVFFTALRYAAEFDAYATLQDVRARFEAALDGGSRETAMRDFIDFWTGKGAWDRLPAAARSTPESRQYALLRLMLDRSTVSPVRLIPRHRRETACSLARCETDSHSALVWQSVARDLQRGLKFHSST